MLFFPRLVPWWHFLFVIHLSVLLYYDIKCVCVCVLLCVCVCVCKKACLFSPCVPLLCFIVDHILAASCNVCVPQVLNAEWARFPISNYLITTLTNGKPLGQLGSGFLLKFPQNCQHSPFSKNWTSSYMVLNSRWASVRI